MRHTLVVFVRLYAIFLLACGTVAFFFSTSKPITALLGGVGGGMLSLILSFSFARRVLWATYGLLSAISIFALTFIWRLFGLIVRYSKGESEVLLSCFLLAAMFFASVFVLYQMYKHRSAL